MISPSSTAKPVASTPGIRPILTADRTDRAIHTG